MSPELINRKYDKRTDIWSCGVVLYIMLCGQAPFVCETHEESTEEFSVQRQIVLDPIKMQGQIWDKISKSAKELILALMEKDAEKRISLVDALQHPWMNFGEEKDISDAYKKETRELLKAIVGFDMPVLLHRITAMNCVKHFLNKNKFKKVKNLFFEINKTEDGRISK